MANRIMFVCILFAASAFAVCPTTPTPHLHAVDDGTGDGFNLSASCGDGWEASPTKEARIAYNKLRTKAAAINLLADSPCVKKGTK